MKRSEFVAIVNQVADEEADKLNQTMHEDAKSENALVEMLAHAISAIPGVAARTTAEILIRSGQISFEED